MRRLKRPALGLAFGAVFMMAIPGATLASGTIERACLASDRPASGRALCACLQIVADAVLSPVEQRRGAAFFADPHKSQEVKASKRAADDAFWARWELFADTSVKHCQ